MPRHLLALVLLALFVSPSQAKTHPSMRCDVRAGFCQAPNFFNPFYYGPVEQTRHVARHHRQTKHKHQRRHHREVVRVEPTTTRQHGNLVTIQTAANPVTVSSAYADKFKGLIDALVAAGFKGRVHCYARGGHVPNSLHYSGQACDFAQTGWGKTVALMYHASSIIERFGLRDGCSFRDCGHVDTGMMIATHRRPRAARVARETPQPLPFVQYAVVDRHTLH